MGEPFVELGAEAVTHLTEKHWEKGYDKVTGTFRNERDNNRDNYQEVTEETRETYTAPRSGVSGRSSARRQKNRLPSPEGSIEAWDKENSRYRRRDSQRSASLDQESEQSARVLRAYETERDDPKRRPETVLSKKDLRESRRDSRMAYQNGSGGSTLNAPGYDRRANSQQPPRSRYYDDDDDSDYDERTGRRYRSTGRGYDDGYDDDRRYDREVVETERYRGPARNNSYGTSRSYGNEGAVTQYRRSTQDVDDYQSKRSRSRGRRDSERSRGRDRSRSYSGSRSRSRSGSRSRAEHSGIRGKIDDTFDTSMKGLGVGLAGAVVGGLAGRQFGHKHKERDILLGALVGGLGANAAENKWSNWKEDKERKLEKDEDRLEQRWDDRRSKSAMR